MPVLGLETGQKLVVVEGRPGLSGLRRDADLTLFCPVLGWASSQFSFTSPQHGSVSARSGMSAGRGLGCWAAGLSHTSHGVFPLGVLGD